VAPAVRKMESHGAQDPPDFGRQARRVQVGLQPQLRHETIGPHLDGGFRPAHLHEQLRLFHQFGVYVLEEPFVPGEQVVLRQDPDQAAGRIALGAKPAERQLVRNAAARLPDGGALLDGGPTFPAFAEAPQ